MLPSDTVSQNEVQVASRERKKKCPNLPLLPPGWRLKERGDSVGSHPMPPCPGPQAEEILHGTKGTSYLFYDCFSLFEAFLKLTIKKINK